MLNQVPIYRLDEEASSNLEASLTAKEKIISELHHELHVIETTLGTEREQHLAEVKKLKALLNEKVLHTFLFPQQRPLLHSRCPYHQRANDELY